MAITATLADLPALEGSQLGISDWFEIAQDRVNHFADATGYLTLSLLIPMWKQVLTLTDAAMGVNYGLNKVRFPAPVPVGSKIRLTATLSGVEQIKGGYQLTVTAVIEREGDKPVCVAEPVFRCYG